MDKERARFVLRSFRPDGADCDDSDFAEALRLATSDRDLGEWLMRERAFDAEFAEALARVKLPEGLREKVLLAMIQDGRGQPGEESECDRMMISHIADIAVPAGLRSQVIEAMERTANGERHRNGWKRAGLPLAAAAGIALAWVITDRSFLKDAPIASADPATISIESVQAGFVNLYESPVFSLEEKKTDRTQLISYLQKKGLPCGGGYVPPGLEGVRSLGCREIVIDGKRGSLICFDEEKGTVHLVIFRRKDVSGQMPESGPPMIEQHGEWAGARWCQGRYAFSLLSRRDKAALAALF